MASAPVAVGAQPLLQRKLEWLTLFRTIAITLLFALAFVQWWSSPTDEAEWHNDSFFYLVVAAVYVSTLIYGLVLRWRLDGERLAYAQVLGDVILASCLVFLTGGIQSPFTFTYSVAVVAAAILLGQRGAFVAAMAAAVAFVSLSVAIWLELIQSPYERDLIPVSRMVYLLSSHILAQLLIAALASYFARQLSATGIQLKAREADLKELVQLQNQIVHAMPSGLITCEPDGKVTFVNPAASSILGVPIRTSEVRHIDTLLPELLRLPRVVRRAEIAVQRPIGRRVLGLTVTPLEGTSGAQLIVFQDLTGLREAEDALRRADHLASLGQVSAQLAHEIRNPLASMRGAAQMLAGEKSDAEQKVKLANILVRESDRLAGLLEDFLKFAKPTPPNKRLAQVDSLVRDTVELMLADPLAERVSVDMQLEPLKALLDPDQFRQVLLNLLRNALAAAGSGGKIRVTLLSNEAHLALSIWDSAGTIAPQDLERIFDPFFTTRDSGTGLGLSTAHSIVVAHGGRILVSSNIQEGTEFRVEMPMKGEGLHAYSGR